PQDESSYTRTMGIFSVREGLNLGHSLNVGIKLELRGDDVENTALEGLPKTIEAYANAPGLTGAALWSEGISLRFDNRDNGDYSRRGLTSELSGMIAHGLAHSDDFFRAEWHTRLLIPETKRLSAAMRLYFSQIWGNGMPFYYQSSLGGP